MRGYRLFVVVALALGLGVAGLGVSGAQLQQGTAWYTPTIQQESIDLLKSGAGEATVRAWATRYHLEVVSLTADRLQLIHEQAPQQVSELERQSCDAKKCDKAHGTNLVKNTLGKLVGLQPLECTATTCTWVKDPKTNGYRRICGGWQCKNVGAVIPQ